jgi:hypothetical protein
MRIYNGTDSNLEPAPEVHPIIYNQTKIVNASTNLFYPVIPFEMLKTYETEPQVIVKVGDLPAVCHNMTCQWNYTIPEGEITAFTHTQTQQNTTK